MKPCYLIDASIYIFRAYFSLPESLLDRKRKPINAVYGFAHFLGSFLQQTKPEYIAVAFDESLTTSFRNDIYPAYKANRELPPPELESQFLRCRQLVTKAGIATFASDRFEADDIIGTLAKRMRRRGHTIHIISSDKDLAQLIANCDTLWDFTREQRYRVGQIRERFGIHPWQMAEYLALIGDPVDNIPGVPGIGEKTAAALLTQFKTIAGIFRNLEKIPKFKLRGSNRLRSVLREHREQLQLAYRLTKIETDAPISFRVTDLKRQQQDVNSIQAFFNELGVGKRLRKQFTKQ